MAYYILFFLGAIALWMGIKANDEVHRLAVTAAAVFPLSWGYFSSPFLFQCLSAIVPSPVASTRHRPATRWLAILCIYQMYISCS